MRRHNIKKLKPGSVVFWNDPDEGICSRPYTIKSIDFCWENNILTIEDTDGSVLECFPREIDDCGDHLLNRGNVE